MDGWNVWTRLWPNLAPNVRVLISHDVRADSWNAKTPFHWMAGRVRQAGLTLATKDAHYNTIPNIKSEVW